MENFKKFNPPIKIDFPPYKNGKTMLEYFYDYYMNNKNKFEKNTLFIPIFWNILGGKDKNYDLQVLLNKLNKKYDYFVVDNSDEKIKYNLPSNTIFFGCSGEENYIIPLLYEDKKCILEKYIIENKIEKKYLASFIGGMTHNIRNIIYEKLKTHKNIYFDMLDNDEKKKFMLENSKLYENKNQNVIYSYYSKEKTDNFITKTAESYFCIAPRGIGRQSYRFYEAIKLNSIPVYIWDDFECLPYKDIIKYDDFCISINIKDIGNLYNIMVNIINSEKYDIMMKNLNNNKKYFSLEFMCEYITNKLKNK
jgi:hypothetical protein